MEDARRYTVVDVGLTTGWPELERAVGSFDAVEALILTHAHFDHIGIAERMGIPVHVHENDVPLTRRPRLYLHERLHVAQMLGFDEFGLRQILHERLEQEGIGVTERSVSLRPSLRSNASP